ncbi:dihydrofolate reductase family protein [Dermabacteraceae bacterium TAE3-ERU5]|nr:dihydrofolate reductase family protein [Dermabacteraceae bacterium TAE3-ERU5]
MPAIAFNLVLAQGEVLPSPLPVTATPCGEETLAEELLPAGDTSLRAVMNRSIDGGVADSSGTSRGLRSDEDFFVFSACRALADAIVVGAQTVRSEPYRRPKGRAGIRKLRPSGKEFPALVVVTASGILPPGLDPDWPTYLAIPTGSDLPAAFPQERILPFGSLPDLRAQLHQMGLRHLLLEGGPSLLAGFLAESLVDELCLSESHLTLGAGSTPLLGGDAPSAQQSARWRLETLLVGTEVTFSRYRRRKIS